MKIVGAKGTESLDEVVLFPFYDHAFTLQRGVELSLISYQGGVGRTKIVLARGAPGSPDSVHVAYYGTVQQVGEEFWMWHLGQGPVEKEDDTTW